MRNLIETALEFSPSPGWIDVSVQRDGTDVIHRVLDQGPGIPE